MLNDEPPAIVWVVMLSHLLPSAERVGLQGLAQRLEEFFSSIKEAAVSLDTLRERSSSYQSTQETEPNASEIAAGRDELRVLLTK